MNIRDAGEELLGEHWQPPLACILGLNLRTVQRWASGQNPVPHGIEQHVLDLLDIARRCRAEAAADRARRAEG